MLHLRTLNMYYVPYSGYHRNLIIVTLSIFCLFRVYFHHINITFILNDINFHHSFLILFIEFE